MTPVAAPAIVLAVQGSSPRLAQSAQESENGGWCVFGADYVDEGTTFRPAVSFLPSTLVRQCRREPFRRWLARPHRRHGPASRAEETHPSWPVAAGTGQGAVGCVRRSLAWRSLYLSAARRPKRHLLSWP